MFSRTSSADLLHPDRRNWNLLLLLSAGCSGAILRLAEQENLRLPASNHLVTFTSETVRFGLLTLIVQLRLKLHVRKRKEKKSCSTFSVLARSSLWGGGSPEQVSVGLEDVADSNSYKNYTKGATLPPNLMTLTLNYLWVFPQLL